MCFPVPYAGFFAPIHTLLVCFGSLCMLTTAQEWRQRWIAFRYGINWFLPKRRRIQNASLRRIREASEPLFEEQSDAVKVSETPYPTNGSGKNLAKVGDIKCIFLYPMPDSSLLITICFLTFHFFMYACHRSRMTAEVNYVFQWYYILARHSWTVVKSGREQRNKKVRERVKNSGKGCKI